MPVNRLLSTIASCAGSTSAPFAAMMTPRAERRLQFKFECALAGWVGAAPRGQNCALRNPTGAEPDWLPQPGHRRYGATCLLWRSSRRSRPRPARSSGRPAWPCRRRCGRPYRPPPRNRILVPRRACKSANGYTTIGCDCILSKISLSELCATRFVAAAGHLYLERFTLA